MLDYKREDLIVVNTLPLSISLATNITLYCLLSFLRKSATYCLGVFWKIYQHSYLISIQRLHLLFHGCNPLVTIICLDRLHATVRHSCFCY